MSIFDYGYQDFHPVPVLQPYEIRHLREALGWSQAKLAQFLGRDDAMVWRWESGQYEPDPLASGVLYGLWNEVFEPYEGPYEGPGPPEPQRSEEALRRIAKVLLLGGAAFFIAKAFDDSKEEND